MTTIGRIPKKITATKPPAAKAKTKAKPKASPSKGSTKSKESKGDSSGESKEPTTLNEFQLALADAAYIQATMDKENWAKIRMDNSLWHTILKRKFGDVTKAPKKKKHAEAPKSNSNAYALFKNSAETKEQIPDAKERHAAWDKHQEANSETFQKFSALAKDQKAKYAIIKEQFETMYLGEDATEESKSAYFKLRAAYEADRTGNNSEDMEDSSNKDTENDEDAEDDEDSAVEDEPPAKRPRVDNKEPAPIPSGSLEH